MDTYRHQLDETYNSNYPSLIRIDSWAFLGITRRGGLWIEFKVSGAPYFNIGEDYQSS